MSWFMRLERTMSIHRLWQTTTWGTLALALGLCTQSRAQQAQTARTISIAAVEVKGAISAEQLAPPSVVLTQLASQPQAVTVRRGSPSGGAS